MAQKRKTKKSSGGRGSAEAIEKRRVARQLNTLLMGGSTGDKKLDGRTEKRRQRLVKELKEGKRGKPLKPILRVQHVNELLEIGETISSLRKQGVKAEKFETSEEVLDLVKRTQQAYSFRPEAWRILGIRVDSEGNPKAARRAKGTAKKKAPAKKRRARKKS